MTLAHARRSPVRAAAAAVLALAASASPARAHIDLITPQPREHGPSREPNSDVKAAPCGQEVNGRTDRVSVFEPGATVEVTWIETTNHRSYYRVAFDADGDDSFPVFLGSGAGTEGIDPRELCPVDGQVILAYDLDDRSGGSHTLQVRLPDVECERCTLQVIQFMYDTRTPYYFQCADLALRRSSAPAGLADGGAGDAGPADAGAADGGARPAPSPSAAPGCFSRIAPDEPPSNRAPDRSGNDTPPPAARPAPSAADARDAPTASARPRSDDGCSIGATSRRGAAPAWLLLIAAGASARARGRRRGSG